MRARNLLPLPLPWRGDGPPERELTRLELVGTACEVAVVTAHLDDDLAPVSADRQARELRDRCWEHRRMALELLSPDTCFDDFTEEGLLHALEGFQARLRDVMRLRRMVDRLLRGGGDSQWAPTGA